MKRYHLKYTDLDGSSQSLTYRSRWLAEMIARQVASVTPGPVELVDRHGRIVWGRIQVGVA